jgi:hypothetical protein
MVRSKLPSVLWRYIVHCQLVVNGQESELPRTSLDDPLISRGDGRSDDALTCLFREASPKYMSASNASKQPSSLLNQSLRNRPVQKAVSFEDEARTPLRHNLWCLHPRRPRHHDVGATSRNTSATAAGNPAEGTVYPRSIYTAGDTHNAQTACPLRYVSYLEEPTGKAMVAQK